MKLTKEHADVLRGYVEPSSAWTKHVNGGVTISATVSWLWNIGLIDWCGESHKGCMRITDAGRAALASSACDGEGG